MAGASSAMDDKAVSVGLLSAMAATLQEKRKTCGVCSRLNVGIVEKRTDCVPDGARHIQRDAV